MKPTNPKVASSRTNLGRRRDAPDTGTGDAGAGSAGSACPAVAGSPGAGGTAAGRCKVLTRPDLTRT
ncbi:hypothetical protein Acsp03_17250 [Actinomadura sp. NBRC 104412]|nr:hypothetical protein Acsp03_17250 [Actinomadura sp. NBRC 104412]